MDGSGPRSCHVPDHCYSRDRGWTPLSCSQLRLGPEGGEFGSHCFQRTRKDGGMLYNNCAGEHGVGSWGCGLGRASAVFVRESGEGKKGRRNEGKEKETQLPRATVTC